MADMRGFRRMKKASIARQKKAAKDSKKQIKPGVYEHYSGGLYFVFFTARQTETDEELVIYMPLYAHPNGGTVPQARPARMWKELVQSKGLIRKRFEFVGDKLPASMGK